MALLNQNTKTRLCLPGGSVADVKMEIPVLVRSLKSSNWSLASFQLDDTFWGVASAAVEQSRRKANMVAQGDGILRLTLESLQTPKKRVEII